MIKRERKLTKVRRNSGKHGASTVSKLGGGGQLPPLPPAPAFLVIIFANLWRFLSSWWNLLAEQPIIILMLFWSQFILPDFVWVRSRLRHDLTLFESNQLTLWKFRIDTTHDSSGIPIYCIHSTHLSRVFPRNWLDASRDWLKIMQLWIDLRKTRELYADAKNILIHLCQMTLSRHWVQQIAIDWGKQIAPPRIIWWTKCRGETDEAVFGSPRRDTPNPSSAGQGLQRAQTHQKCWFICRNDASWMRKSGQYQVRQVNVR